MAETLEFLDYQLFGPSIKYSITNKKSGIDVNENGQEITNSYSKITAIKKLVSCCIDMDEWKHSWHKSVDYMDKETRKELVEIITGKIAAREEEVKQLKFCLKVMSRKLRYC